MKFTAILSLLALSASLVTAQQGCDACTQVDKLTKCTKDWVDAVNACMNPPCNHQYSMNPIFGCTAVPGGSAASTGTASATATSKSKASSTNASSTSASTTAANTTSGGSETSGGAATTAYHQLSPATSGAVEVMGVIAAVGLGGLALL